MLPAVLITFIRHGESVSNAAGIWQGHADAPLSPRGLAQADALAARLCSEPVTRIVSSDLRRAASTAAAVGEAVGRTPAADAVWREINLGRWEGLSREEVADRFPDQIAALARGEDVAVGGGERWSDLRRRVGGAFDALVAAGDPDEHVLVVVHGGVIVTLISELLGVFAARPRPIGKLSNTSMTRVRIDAAGITIASYNDGLHIDADASWRREASRGRTVVELRASEEGADSVDLEGADPSPRLVRGHALATWAASRLVPDARARLASPQPGARCLSVSSRRGGTVWSWNEGA